MDIPAPLRFTPPSQRLALHLVEEQSGVVLLRIPLAGSQIAPMLDGMGPSPLPAGRATDGPTQVIAGRIVAEPHSLTNAVMVWLEHLAARKKRPHTIRDYRSVVERAMKVRGWRAPGDMAAGEVSAYLDSCVQELGWKGTTYNRNLAVFRSLSRHLVTTGALAQDPMDKVGRAVDDSGDGARAATTDEARLFVRTAWERQLVDRRAIGKRALYYTCLFLAGCRADEPSRWRRRHLFLQHETPHVYWSEDINKNRRRQEVALHPELAELLGRHLAEQDEAREAAGLLPLGEDAPVFVTAVHSPQFRADRDRAGIEHKDRRGRPFSAHSARKWFETELIAAGVNPRMVDRLMRHSSGTPGRYFDPSLADQAAAIGQLPTIWPAARFPVDNPGGCLTPGGRVPQYVSATMSHLPQNASRTPGRATTAASWLVSPEVRPGVVHARPGGTLQGASSWSAGSVSISGPGMPIPGLVIQDCSTPLSNLLAALAEFLRSNGGQPCPSQFQSPPAA